MGDDTIVWCVISPEEMLKCLNFSEAVQRDKSFLGIDYMELRCVRGSNKEECMSLLDQEKVHVTSLDAGEVFIGGRYHSLIPIMHEVCRGLTVKPKQQLILYLTFLQISFSHRDSTVRKVKEFEILVEISVFNVS